MGTVVALSRLRREAADPSWSHTWCRYCFVSSYFEYVIIMYAVTMIMGRNHLFVARTSGRKQQIDHYYYTIHSFSVHVIAVAVLVETHYPYYMMLLGSSSSSSSSSSSGI